MSIYDIVYFCLILSAAHPTVRKLLNSKFKSQRQGATVFQFQEPFLNLVSELRKTMRHLLKIGGIWEGS